MTMSLCLGFLIDRFRILTLKKFLCKLCTEYQLGKIMKNRRLQLRVRENSEYNRLLYLVYFTPRRRIYYKLKILKLMYFQML